MTPAKIKLKEGKEMTKTSYIKHHPFIKYKVLLPVLPVCHT